MTSFKRLKCKFNIKRVRGIENVQVIKAILRHGMKRVKRVKKVPLKAKILEMNYVSYFSFDKICLTRRST